MPKVKKDDLPVPMSLDEIREKVVPAVSHAAASAKDLSTEYALVASDWAKPRIEQGRQIASPAMSQAQHAAIAAAHALTPMVNEARDRVEKAMPTITERVNAALAASNAAKSEVLARGSEAALVLTGNATVKRKSTKKTGGVIGGLLAAAGIMAAAGAVAGYLAKRSRDREDPWAQPLADPYVAPPAATDDATAALEAEEGVVVADGDPAVEAAAEVEAEGGEGQNTDGEGERTQVIDLTADGMPPAEPKRD